MLMSAPVALTVVSAVELHAQTQLDRITAPVTQVTMEVVHSARMGHMEASDWSRANQ